MELYLIFTSVVILILALVGLLVILNEFKRNNLNTIKEIESVSNMQYKEINEFKTLINSEINEIQTKISNDMFYMNNHINNSINSLNNMTSSRLNQIENSVSSSLFKSYDKTEKLMISVSEKMTTINETQNSIKEISKDITSLGNILNDKKTRGIFGEIELYSILENVFGTNSKRYIKQAKLSNGLIVDALILADKPLGNIAVDSKFPLESYNRIYGVNEDKSIKEKAKTQFKKDILKHINDISSKYLIQNETADIAFMFVPSESIYAEIYANYDDIVEYSYKKHVYIVSPTTLMAYITAIKSIYLNQKRDENIDLLKSEFGKLSVEFKRYEERFNKLYSDYERLNSDFRDLSITNNKIINRFNSIDNVNINKEAINNEK